MDVMGSFRIEGTRLVAVLVACMLTAFAAFAAVPACGAGAQLAYADDSAGELASNASAPGEGAAQKAAQEAAQDAAEGDVPGGAAEGDAAARAGESAGDRENLVDPTQRADNSFIYDTTIASLVDQASLYDKRTVQITGEAIGDRIREERGRGYWVMIASTEPGDASSISVLLSGEQSRQVDRFGKYGATGTILQVRGIYHQACDEHEGLPDIHATSSAVIAKGIDDPDRFEARDFIPGSVAVLVGLALMGVYYYVRERSR